MGFIILLLLSTISIAGSAAFFSIYGLARIFSGAFWPIVIMASALEGGKLVSASLLYRYWKTMSTVMKTCLISSVTILMFITSLGIFGFLSAAYQNNALTYEQHNQQITLLENEKTEALQLKAERLARQEEINKQVANLPSNVINGRQRLIYTNKIELEQINKDVAQYTNDIRDHTTQISKLKNQTIQETAHVGPIIFMAKAFGLGVDTATKWLIILIMFVFDPLAVTLTIASNMVILRYKKSSKKEKANMIEQTTGFGFGNFEPSDPPEYSEDKQYIKSKDGMTFRPVAPNAAAHAPITTQTTFATSALFHPTAAQAPEPIQTITFNDPIVEPPNHVKKAFDMFTRTDLSPQEQRMKEELESLLNRHQEVLATNKNRSKS